jgi:hypothetical protein
MDIRERAKENLRSAFAYFQYKPHEKFNIIGMAEYNTKADISHAEWLSLYAEISKEQNKISP